MCGFRTPELPREQILLWGRRLDDAVPMDHAVRHVYLLLRANAFQQTFTEWERCYVLTEGQPPYHPRDLASLYIYGMMNRIRSSRQLEAACYNRIDVIWLMSGQHPDHATIAGFVRAHGLRLRQLHKDVLKVAIAAGLVRLQHVAYDSTKIAADAGKSSLCKETEITAQLAQLDERLAELEREWQENEQCETGLLGDEVPWTPGRSDSVPQRLAKMQRMQERLQRALRAIERRRETSEHPKLPQARASVIDPDSRFMPSKEGGRRLNYSAQLGVDTTNGVIVAADVNDQVEDGGQLVPMLERTRSNCGRLPDEASADSSYNIGPDLATLEQIGVQGYLPENNEPSGGERAMLQVADSKFSAALNAVRAGRELSEADWAVLPRDGKGRITKDAFVYDRERNEYRCPMGQRLTPWRIDQDRKNWGERLRQQYKCGMCKSCPRHSDCCINPVRGRTIGRDQYEECRERLQARMASPEGQSRYRLRRQTVEPRIGFIKHVCGVRRFLCRGAEAVRTEWVSVCTAVNLGILLRNWRQVRAVL